eukprot:TRINITY_DN4940_c0_g1_i2.p1 TRINITY_DN4940_c0_g1~~TRINITY_DN4940_c0_g1_i2.p1  ORF type:complete len:425 (+),score=97.95 TRINITY_DN4940_c0_g1_i2:276-1550(+)
MEEAAPLLGSSDTRKTRLGAIVAVSCAFVMLFLAYNSLQNYVTSLLPGNLGNESLAVLYVSVCLFVFSAPHISARLGDKWTMVVGSLCYLVYMGSVIHAVRWIVLLAAVVIGFGAAILWVAVGSYITKASAPDELGKNNGLFWGTFQLSGILGNLFAYFVFNHLNGSTSLFIALTAAGAVGVLILLFIPNDRLQNVAVPAPPPIRQEIKATVDNLFTVEQAALAYIVIFSGLELAFWTGEFPQLLPANSIGLVLTFAGVGEVIGAMGLSRLSDRFGCSVLVILGGLVYCGGLALSAWLKHTGLPGPSPDWEHVSWIAYLAAVCFGIGDSLLNTQTYALIGKLFDEKETTRAFTVFQLYQNVGSAGGYYMAVPLPMHGSNGSLGLIWVQLYLLVVGALLFCWVERRYLKRQQAEAINEKNQWDVN